MSLSARALREAAARIRPEIRQSFARAVKAYSDGDRTAFSKWRWLPVDPATFFCHEYYLNARGVIYPVIMDELLEMNSGKYEEIVLTGGIGSGKTSIAIWCQLYQLYLISCLNNPQITYGLDPTHEVVVVFQSLSMSLAEDLDYARFKAAIKECKYFNEQFRHRVDLESKLVFPNRVIVKPISSLETASIGQNVIGGIIDEVNFMAVIEKSKMAADGGTYNQAIELYNSIARRRKSRFLEAGSLPGLLCLVSSKKVPGQFTDKKTEEAKHNPRIYVYDKRVWDVKPDSFGKARFRIFVGDMTRKPRILGAQELVSEADKELIDEIPVEYLQEFQDDIVKALRDIAGRSTMAIHPFMTNVEAVAGCFGKRKPTVIPSKVDFVTERPKIIVDHISGKKFKRFAHIDLGLRKDSAGLVIGHVPRFVAIERGGTSEKLPVIAIDCSLEIVAPPGDEIRFENLRRVLYKLRELGMPISWVTLDSYQSVDTMQILRANGFATGLQSMDTTMEPYMITRAAFYDGRIEAPEHEKLLTELLTLEQDFKKGKVDHNAHGSKDISDALAGVVYGLSMRREIWAQFGVSPVGWYQHSRENLRSADDATKSQIDVLRAQRGMAQRGDRGNV